MSDLMRPPADPPIRRQRGGAGVFLKPMPSLMKVPPSEDKERNRKNTAAGNAKAILTQNDLPREAVAVANASLRPEKNLPPVGKKADAPLKRRRGVKNHGVQETEAARQSAAVDNAKPSELQKGRIDAGKKKDQNAFITARLFKRYFIRLTILTAILGMILCVFSYIHNKDTAMMRISLNYEEANKGLAPNMERLNMYDIISDDLLSYVISTSDFGNLSPSQLRDYLSLQASGYGGGDYISTEYILTMNLYDSGISTDPKSLLGLIGQEYVKRFYRNYIGDINELFSSFLDVSQLEYPEIVDYYTARLDTVSHFIQNRSSQFKSFRSETTGQTYVDIDELVNHLISIDLEQLNSFVKQTGVIKNTALYLSKLNYLIYSKSSDFEKQFQYYGTYTDAITDYNIVQTAIVMVPTYDDSGQYYMSMTKTGVDDIAITAQNWNEQSSNTRLQIDAIKDNVKTVQSHGRASAADLETADRLVRAMEEKINTLIQNILVVDKEYLSYRYKNPITCRMLEIGTTDKIDLKTNLIICVVFYVALWLIVGRQEFRRKKAGGL